jgi:predicted GIY-YIG superfamily endonuclease
MENLKAATGIMKQRVLDMLQVNTDNLSTKELNDFLILSKDLHSSMALYLNNLDKVIFNTETHDETKDLPEKETESGNPDSAVIYVIQLEGDNYFVGRTTNLQRKMKQHFDGEGEPWTKLHRPIKLLKTFYVSSNGKNEERNITIEYMKIYGWQKVRGYTWRQCNMKNPPVCLRSFYNVS